jgi:hypothetical protein
MKSTHFCPSHRHRIESYLKNPKKISRFCKSIDDYVQEHRFHYHISYKGKCYPTPRSKILDLPNLELQVLRRSIASPGIKNLFTVQKGCWRVDINKLLNENRLDFVISVAAAYAGCDYIYRFSPEIIQSDLTARFGREVYLQWKQAVTSDMESLSEILYVVRQKITHIIPSVTCGERSARLCEKVGIPVKQGIAFLLPYRKGF